MLFTDTTFLVCTQDPAVQKAITENGGSVTLDTRVSLQKLRVSHVISNDYSFRHYSEALDHFIPVTTASWVHDSLLYGSKRNYRLYSPLPLPFMDKVVLCAADNLPQGDKELMYAATRAFGGQYLDCLSSYTTHLVAADLSNNKAVVAANICRREPMNIHIVLPEWVDACMRHQQHVPEADYLLTNREVLRTRQPQIGAVTGPNGSGTGPNGSGTGPNGASSVSDVFHNKSIYIHSDFNASEHTKQAVEALAQSAGATIVHEAEESQIDIYVGKYRQGSLFWNCFSSPHTDVASVQWLYYVIMRAGYVDPMESMMIHFPVPPKPVPQFIGLRISITGIGGDARHYLTQLMAAMGASFTRTLDANNDILVCGSSSGEKYSAALTRWKNVKIVNYLWVEECFQHWQFLDPSLSRYREIDSPDRGLGQTRLKREFINAEREGLVLNEPQSEIESSQARTSQNSLYKTPSGTLPRSPSKQDTGEADEEIEENKESEENEENEENEKNEEIEEIEEKQREKSKTKRLETDEVGAQTTPRARSAKQKASMKLHNNMEDLNKYTSMAKSVRKMKTYMEELEKTAHEEGKKRSEEGKRKSDGHEGVRKKSKVDEKVEKKEKEKVEKKDAKSTESHLKVIMTGCEQTIVLNRGDIGKFAKVGISIVNEYSPKKKIDTLVAPKILRTEKFLKSLSKAKRIVHPEYLSKVLERIGPDTTYADLATEFNIDDYALDKIVPVKKINEDLGYTGKGSGLRHLLEKGRGHVFEGLKLNLSSNLNGGPELISSILLEHGLSEAKIVKLSEKGKPDLVPMENEIWLVAHKAKDKKSVSQMKDVTVVDWDWCVKSIFHGERQPKPKK